MHGGTWSAPIELTDLHPCGVQHVVGRLHHRELGGAHRPAQISAGEVPRLSRSGSAYPRAVQMAHAQRMIDAREVLCDACNQMTFEGAGVAAVYNPIDYARPMADAYLRRYVDGPRRVLMFGMNPGPWGMAQNGVPFGEVAAVRDFLKLDAPIGRPERWGGEHPKRPVVGMDCTRSEVSGRRVWALLKDRYGTADAALSDLHVLNFCPLVFMGETGRNITPDRLTAAERAPLEAACRAHLVRVLEILEPEHVVGVGVWAEKQAAAVVEAAGSPAKVSRILHPSPASPLSNKDWPGTVTRQLIEAGVWH